MTEFEAAWAEREKDLLAKIGPRFLGIGITRTLRVSGPEQ